MSEALDGQLDATQQAAFDAHLAECPACREGFEALRETVEHLHGLDPVAPPPNLIVDINAAIDRPRGLRVNWNIFSSPPMRVALAASFMVVVGLLGIQYLDLTPRDTEKAVREMPASDPVDAYDSAPVATAKPLSAPAPVMAPPSLAAPRPAPVDAPAESVVMLEEDAAAEDDDDALDDTDTTIARKMATSMMDREAGDKRKHESRSSAYSAPRKSVDAPAVAPQPAPAVASARMDRDEAVWAEPAPEGVVGGLAVGGEAQASSEAGRRQVMRARRGPVFKHLADVESEEAMHRAKLSEPVRVVHISVTGLARDVVMQAVEEPVEEEGAADSKKEKRRAAAPGVAASRVVAPKPDMMLDLVADEVMQEADRLTDRREAEEFEDKAGKKAEYIVLHLSPARLESFLTRLRALDEGITVGRLPTSGGAGELIEVQIQLVP
ncbi:MAG: zf-HC2 domain-containing protein [Kiritimatiellia bacterium]|nr:zf-HC2 domain-containing protein [Kiritimatiellia bacterium]MDP6630285.1 zf-HC2 domain-containing protein [Kiritimatiellia bacterium]MDP7024134.1 zf-HC2 domain-containing protein [Kiritimatiellia bacterium]